jgi:hypothetical protein
MIDDSNNFVHHPVAKQSEYPPPARFDESATANAQPVEPLLTGRIAVWKQRARTVGQVISSKTRVLALVIIGALAAGALGGTMFVRQHAWSTDSASVVDQAATELPTSTDLQKAPGGTRAVVSATVLPNTGRTISRSRNRHARHNRQRALRAYRVAVIK